MISKEFKVSAETFAEIFDFSVRYVESLPTYIKAGVKLSEYPGPRVPYLCEKAGYVQEEDGQRVYIVQAIAYIHFVPSQTLQVS